MELFTKAHLFQGLNGSLTSFRLSYAGNSQSQFYISQNCLMRDQIIALKNKTDSMVPVRIPVPVFILFSRNTVNDQISAVIPVQTSDNVQKCGLS